MNRLMIKILNVSMHNFLMREYLMQKNIISLACFFLIALSPLTHAVNPTITPLSYQVVDAEYSKTLDRLISVSANPAQLHIYNPISKTELSVKLPLIPSSVSVSPDGLFAAVGHNAKVSYVDLSKGTLIKSLPVTADVLDLVLANNGFIYAFPRVDQWVNIHSINITTKAESLNTGMFIRAGTLAKLHPNGNAIYGANNGLSPSDIEKYDISQGAAKYGYDSPYHGDYAMCGDLWISEEGAKIFTRCGNVFRSTDVKTSDMTYAGKLGNTNYVKHLSHSKKAGRVLVIPSDDTVIQLYNYNTLGLISNKPLPKFVVNAKPYPAHGRFVFYSSDASKIFVIAQADSTAGLLADYGVATFVLSCNPLNPNDDCDQDGILNLNDNCISVPNSPALIGGTQLDSDHDKYGNACDTDLTNDGNVDVNDFTAWLNSTTAESSRWLSTCQDANYGEVGDFNGDCKINSLDSDIFMQFLFKKPGPSCVDLPIEQRGSNC